MSSNCSSVVSIDVMPAIAAASGLSPIALPIAGGIGDGIAPASPSPAPCIPFAIVASPELSSCVNPTPAPD